MRAIERVLAAALLSGVAVLPATQARADDDDDEARPGVATQVEGIETENIFGYTLGTDTGEKGEKELTFTLDGRLSRLGLSGTSRYSALTGEAEFEYALTDDLKISVGAAASNFDINRIFDMEDRSGGGFGGAFFEVKYRFLNRETAPFGLSLTIEPEWARLDESSGENGTAYGIEFRLAADKELVKDFLFAAVNLVYEPEWERESEDWVSFWSSGSGLEVSGAVTAQVVKDIFLGGEIRYLAAFDGAALNERQGWALYLGPTLYAQVTENFYVKAAWSIQVTGNATDIPFGNLDLVNFERQQGRLQVGFQF